MNDDGPLTTPHAFEAGDPAIWSRRCQLCGKASWELRHCMEIQAEVSRLGRTLEDHVARLEVAVEGKSVLP